MIWLRIEFFSVQAQQRCEKCWQLRGKLRNRRGNEPREWKWKTGAAAPEEEMSWVNESVLGECAVCVWAGKRICVCVWVRVCLSVHVFACLRRGAGARWGRRWANDMSRDVRLIYLLFPQIEALSITKCKQGEKKEPHTSTRLCGEHLAGERILGFGLINFTASLYGLVYRSIAKKSESIWMRINMDTHFTTWLSSVCLRINLPGFLLKLPHGFY